MGVISLLVQHGASKLPGIRHVSRWKWAAGGASAVLTGATIAAGAHHAHYSFGHEYGSGTTAAYALAGVYPITAIPLIIMEGGKAVGDAAYKHQRAKRQSSFMKSATSDKFGTINQMRQYSIQRLSRDHTSKQRVLGNEAMLLHR